MVLGEEDGELPSNTKNLALKSRKDELPSDEEDSDDDDEEDAIYMISKGLARILKIKKQSANNTEYPPTSKPRGKFSNSNKKTRVLTCFECGETGHLVKDCPQKKRTNFRKMIERRKLW